MKEFNPMDLQIARKQVLIRKIFNAFSKVNQVCSVTFVGSFCDRQDLSGISDIDIVVICQELSRVTFESCINAVKVFTGEDLGFPGKKVCINSSFGPLKFDTQDQIVLHLMIYDRAGHRQHVIHSPFTCYDWERSRIFNGLSLREIYPVLSLQPDDFIDSRRGLEDYIHDLEAGVLSYRVYEFDQSGQAFEVKKNVSLDDRQSGEYGYHIIKNLISNYAKLLMQKNVVLAPDAFYEFWYAELIPTRHLIPNFQKWEEIKFRREAYFPPDVLTCTKEFLFLFGLMIQETWKIGSKRVTFIRHAKTSYNDGSFLGQGRDPGIIEKITSLREKYKIIYSSPLRRAIESAEGLQPVGTSITIDKRLSEQNYGDAEGLTFGQFIRQYPEIVAGWDAGQDVNFPNGENIQEVEKRLLEFLEDLLLSEEQNFLVVTHNVVLRCLLGRLLGLEMRDWYKLRLGHLETFELVSIHKTKYRSYYLNLSKEQKANLLDDLMKKNIQLAIQEKDSLYA